MTPWTKLSKEERFSEDIEMKLSEYGIADDCKVVVPATPVSDPDPVVFLLHEEFTRPGGCSRIDRHTRHMYDIVKMMDKQFATDAINNAVMYNEIIAHRKSFTAWTGLDYATHSPQTITFVPPLEVDAILRNDYEQMKYGFIYKDAPTYEHLIERLNTLQLTFRQLDWK